MGGGLGLSSYKTLKLLVAALAAVGLSFAGLTVSAATVNLTMNSWGDLATAVKNAAAGDTISVTPGTADTTYQATSTIKISKSLTIVSADNANQVRISNSSNKVLAFEISGSGTEVRFEKIDFSGSGVSTAANPARGMIYSSAGKLRLSYCTFNGCTVGINDVTGSESAGAVTASGDLLRMNDCTFRYCRAVNHCAGSLGRQTAAPQCAGAVASIAKNTIVRRCSFVDNRAEGFANCAGGDKWVPGAIMAGCYAVPTDATPPVLTIMNSTFADNSGSSAVFALNNGFRIIGSTFVGNDGRALRFKLLQGFKDQYCQTGSPNGNLYIVNSVFLGNKSEGQYCDFTCSDVQTYAYYSVFSKQTNFGSPGIDCKFLSESESVAWRKWFLNDAAPCVTAVLGADHYAYPLSPRAYEGGNNVAKTLYYDGSLDVSPSVYGYGGNPKSPVWSSFADHATGDRPVADQGVDLRRCQYGDTHYPSCGSARSIPTSVRFKVTDRPEDDEVVAYMWNYEDVEFPENCGEKEGHSFKTWTCNGKSYAPGDTVSVNVLSEQCYGGNGIPGQEIEVGSVWEGMWCTLNFQTAEGQAPSHDPIYNNHIRKQYGEAVTIRCPKDSVYDGYWVSGWATSAERAAAGTIDFADGEEVASLSLFGSVDLYWVNRKPNKATYSFKKTTPGGSAEGIGGTEFSKVVETDDASVVPTCPFYRPGYRFDHWYSGDCEENLVEYYPGWGYGKVAANGSTVEVYPHWTQVGDFTINLKANNGTDTTLLMPVQSSNPSDIRLPSASDVTFSYAGHTFVGWSKTATDQYDLFPAGVSAWDVAEQGKAIVDLYAVWADAEGSTRTCPTTDPSIQLQIRILDPGMLTCALEHVICAGDMPANWTIPDTANDGTKNWMIVMYDGTVADDLWAVTEVTIGQHVAAGAECLQEDDATYTRSKILVPAANATYASIEGLLVSKDKKHLLAVPCGWDNAEHVLEIPEGIETVEAGACNTLKKIKTVIIPSTVNTDGALKTGSFGTDAYGQNWGVNPLSGGGGISQFYFRGNFKPSYMETPDVFHATGWAVQTCPPIIRDDLGFVVGYIPHPTKNPNNPAHKCAVAVPEGVTSILGGAFEGCVQMTSLTLPSTLETIGDWGFEGCTNLTEVALPEAVKYIGDEAFAGCSNLVEVTGEPYLGNDSVGIDVVAGTKLAANADAAGEGVMFGSVLVYQGANGSQETVDVPGTVTGVAGGAFRNASGVVNVNLPLSVAWIGYEAFADNADLKRIRLYVGTVVDSYFADQTSNESLTELEIYGDDAADTLDGGVWYGDGSHLDTLVIGAGIKTIPDGTYQWTSSGDMDVFEVIGGQDLVSVGRTAFEGTSFADPYYKNRAIGGFYVGYFPEDASDKNAVMGDFSPWDSKASGQLRRVSPDAFKTLTNLQTLKFGRYVEAGQLTGGMFCDLTSLTAYIIDAAAENYATDSQGILYNKDMTKIIAVPKALAGTITIPESVTEIGDHAFEDCKATTIKGGKNVVNIGVDAFKNCPANPFLNLSRLQLFDLNGELVQNIPATTLEAVQLPHPTNFAAVVASLPYPMWPRSGKWICTADGNAYSKFTPDALDSVYEFTPEVVDASGTYSLRYDRNAADATGEMALVADLVTGDLCELKRNKFVREGYAFTGWNTRPDGTGDAFADEAFAVFDWPEVLGGDTVTLYAQWTAKVAYTLAFDADATYATDMPEPMACYVGDAVPLPSDKPVREGWKLTGWRNADSSKAWTVDDDFSEVVAAGTTYTLYATWAAQETSGCSYTDAKGTTWRYTRTGDAIEIVSVAPGPTVFSLEVPSAIKGGTVNQESARKVLPVRANGVWWWYEVLSGNATCLLTSHAGALPDAVSLPGEITGWPGQLTVVGVGEDAFSTDENVTKVTILTDGEWKEIWGEKNGSGKVAKIHVPGAAPSNWQGSLRYLFVNAETCCYDPEETSWTAYKATHAGDGLVFAEEGTYEIRFNKNAVDATGEMPNKVCVIGRKYPPLEGSERINYTRGDWTFVDWFCDPACTEKAELGGEFWNLSTTPDAIVDVYAKWVKYAPKAVVENGGKTLRFVFDDANYGVKGDDWFDVSENEAIEYNSSICNFPAWGKNPAYVYTNVVIDASFGAYRPKGCQGWFVGCFDVVAFEGLANLNTSSVTNMAYMFSNCEKVGSLDLSGFDTSKVVDMNLMFSRCANLTRIDATGRFTTEALQTPSSYMFYGCAKLEGGAGTKYAPEKTDASYAHVDGGEGDPGYFSGTYVPRTAKAVLADGGATLRFVFDRRDYGVKGTDWFAVADAETIDPESESVPWSACYGTVTKVVFDESFVSYRPTQCGRWFSGFTALEAIEGLANLDTSSAASFAWMFSGCASLTSLDLSAFDTANVTDMTGMFSGCSSLVTISVTESFTTASVVTSDGMFAGCTALKGGNGKAFDAGAPTDKTYARIDKAGTPGYFTEAVFPTTAKAVLENGGKTLRFVFDNAYYGAKGVKWFAVADAEAIDPEEADVPWYGGCAETVTNVVFDSSFAGYKPTRCGSWFYGFEQLETIEGLANFDTSNVTDMRYMFSGCASLTSLDLSNFDTSNVTNMHDMFGVCASLTSLDLSAFDTANVTNMSWMFWGCASLTSLDLSAFDTANVTEMIGMLGECTALEEVDLSSFDTANVTEMSGMFYNCTALEEVDLSSFDTANVTEMSSMFYNCPALTTIYVSESFVAGGVSPATFQGFVMFSGCESLVGGNGTEYSSDHVDADYARIDGKGGLPGYFTEAAEPPPGPTPTKVKVTFDAAGGTASETSRQVTEGAAIGTLPTATRTGYDFAGWFTAGGDPVTAGTAVTAAVTYFAHWTPIVYTISYELAGGVNASANPTSYTIESAAITLAAPTREGYVFAGWTPAGVIPSGSTGDRTFTAGWDEILPGAFVVAFDANGGTVGETTRQVTEGAAIGTLPTATRDGFDFLGWFTQPSGGDEVTAATAVTDDVVYYAQWVIQSGGPVSLDDPRVAFAPIPDQTYANELCEPAVTMTFNGQPCAEGGDFEVVYENNDFVGTATATVTGVGNFTGTQTLTFQILPLTAVVGRYLAYDLEKDLGVVIDADYKAGDKVAVKAEGLAKGLKVAQDKLTGNWMMTGVPTETLDCRTRTMYARVTVTCKDKTKGVKGKLEMLWPLPLEIVSGDLKPLAVGALNQVYGPADIATLWPEVADAKANPKDWSFKGWPAGIKYNSGTKAASWSYKLGGVSVKTNVEPCKVYGIPTKAGEYTITATHKYKLGKTTVSETCSAVLTVWGDDGAVAFRYTDQAYVATATKALDATWKSFSGLPAGIKYTTKLVKADAKKGTPEYPAYSLYGTPTKPGVFAVTATKVDPADAKGKKTVKETFLWKIAPATAPTFALDMGTAPITDLKAQIVQGANQAFAIEATAGAKVTVSGLPSGLKLVQDKTTKLYSVEGIASKPGEYFVTFKTVLNGVTTVTTAAFTVKGNPFVATYRGYTCARPAVGEAHRLALAEVTVAAAGTVKLTYTEGKTKYTANVKSFDWDDATGKGTAEGLVLKVSSADKKLGYGDRRATVTFEDCGTYLYAKLEISDANGSSLKKSSGSLYATVKATEVPLPASQTFVFRTKDGKDTNALATVSLAYDAKKATAAFSGKLYDGTAVKATVPVIRWDDGGTSDDYAFAPFLVIGKDGTVYCFDAFSSYEDGGYIYWVREDGEDTDYSHSTPADYTDADAKFAELVPATGAFTFNWGSDAEVVGASTESFAFEVTTDAKGNPKGVAIYDADPQPGEKPLATVTAKVGKTTGAISVSFTSKKGDKAKYAVELVWRDEQLFAGQVTRTWKGPDEKTGKPVNKTAFGTAEVK